MSSETGCQIKIKRTDKETFGFNSTKNPPPVKELSQFEDKMLALIQNINFKTQRVDFQNKLARGAKKIRSDDKLLVAADKTTNFYRLDTASYKQLLNTTITKSYKKAPDNATNKIISSEKKIAQNLDLDNRIDALATKDSFITLKDHKSNFNNKPTCKLINPSKSEIGIISKQILQRINSKIVNSTKLNQWKNTDSVIIWFNELTDKSDRSFISFDIVDFYPSISEKLLLDALSFASNYLSENDF